MEILENKNQNLVESITHRTRCIIITTIPTNHFYCSIILCWCCCSCVFFGNNMYLGNESNINIKQ